MATILGANTLSSGYDVDNSVRFNDGDSSYIYRDLGTSTAGSGTKFTFSVWVKRSTITNADQFILSCGVAASNHLVDLFFQSDDTLKARLVYNNTLYGNLTTNAVYRDTSSWYHIVINMDTTQGTAANRTSMYVNGAKITSFSASTRPNQNSTFTVNNNTVNSQRISLGRNEDGTTGYFDGYMAEAVWIDGSTLAASSFGEYDSSSPNVWKPKDVSDLTYGTHGAYLDFEDSSALGNDVSGNNLDYTATNLAATDQSTDTCTNNFATLNPLDSFSSGATFSEANVVVQSTTSNRGIITGTFGLSKGKWYWEVKTSASAGTHSGDEWNFIGVSNLPAPNTDNILGLSGTNSNKLYEYSIQGYDGNKHNNGDQGSYAASFTTNDIIGVYLDLDNNRIYWSKNGSWADGSGNNDEADPNGYVSMTDPASTPGGFYLPACGDGGSNVNKTWQWNFGGTPGFSVSSGNADPNGYGNFEYPTEGAYAICSKNLAKYG